MVPCNYEYTFKARLKKLMGLCTSATAKLRPELNDSSLKNSTVKKANLKRQKTLSLRDTKGFKKSDDIHEFY